ncbi:MAG: alpha/beta fold hydrolase [Phormidesmis sp. RL_2_1]|nr:alpha/beta fold hydrolase [Phormidesmis sp. RL_2_1]
MIVRLCWYYGLWNTAGIFSTLQTYLQQEGWSVHALSMTPNNGDAPLETLAEQLDCFVCDRLGAQEPFDVVGFSMGGLVSRYYVQRLDRLNRVQKLVTVSTPHQGTLLSLFSHRLGIRQMQPRSTFLRALNQDCHRLEQLKFVSLWTPFDVLILPPWSCDPGIGQVRRLSIPTHNQMIRDTQGLAAIAQALR